MLEALQPASGKLSGATPGMLGSGWIRQCERVVFALVVSGLLLAGACWAQPRERAVEAAKLKSATRSVRTVRTLAPGIEHLHWHIVEKPDQPGPWNINALRVDLAQPGVAVRVVPATGGLEKTSGIARRVGAIAAVNGGYFNAEGPLGLVVVKGSILSSTLSWKPPRAVFGTYEDEVWIDLVNQQGDTLVPLNPTRRFDWSRVQYALGAGPQILSDMRVAINEAAEGFDALSGVEPDDNAAWTVLGVRGKQLFLVTTDGYQPGLSIGWKLAQSAGFLVRECSAWRGMALAGGGSTTMVIRGEVVNFPADRDTGGELGVERPVANAICIFSDEASP